MNIRSQGVPLKTRYIREDANRFHPMSDGADFKPSPALEQEIVRAQYEAYCSDAGICPDPADDFPIDDEPENVVCTTIGTCNGWRRAHESAFEVGKLQAEVNILKRELAYTEKQLADMTEARDDYRSLAQKFAKEAS